MLASSSTRNTNMSNQSSSSSSSIVGTRSKRPIKSEHQDNNDDDDNEVQVKPNPRKTNSRKTKKQDSDDEDDNEQEEEEDNDSAFEDDSTSTAKTRTSKAKATKTSKDKKSQQKNKSTTQESSDASSSTASNSNNSILMHQSPDALLQFFMQVHCLPEDKLPSVMAAIGYEVEEKINNNTNPMARQDAPRMTRIGLNRGMPTQNTMTHLTPLNPTINSPENVMRRCRAYLNSVFNKHLVEFDWLIRRTVCQVSGIPYLVLINTAGGSNASSTASSNLNNSSNSNNASSSPLTMEQARHLHLIILNILKHKTSHANGYRVIPRADTLCPKKTVLIDAVVQDIIAQNRASITYNSHSVLQEKKKLTALLDDLTEKGWLNRISEDRGRPSHHETRQSVTNSLSIVGGIGAGVNNRQSDVRIAIGVRTLAELMPMLLNMCNNNNNNSEEDSGDQKEEDARVQVDKCAICEEFVFARPIIIDHSSIGDESTAVQDDAEFSGMPCCQRCGSVTLHWHCARAFKQQHFTQMMRRCLGCQSVALRNDGANGSNAMRL